MSAILNTLRPTLRTAAATPAARAFSTSSPRSIARMQLIGRLGAEPELQATASGQEVVRYVLGSSMGPAANRKTSWFRVSSFQTGGGRDYLLGLPKGTLLFVEGDASLSTYEDANGKRQSNLNIAQRNFEVLKRPFNPNNEGQQGEQQ